MSKRRDPLPRLNVNPSLSMQQPMGGPGQALYSPALPTSIQQSFHPAFPMNNPLQTPMQGFFPQQITGGPVRPGHHHQASMQLAAAGIHPPSFVTPVTGGHFPRPSMALGPGGVPLPASHHPFPNRNRRQLSIGGPPKAVLGGPARKLSPLPATSSPANAATTPAPAAATPAPVKTKKVIVNLPKETVQVEGEEEPTRQPWARTPMAEMVLDSVTVVPVEISTAEEYPSEAERHGLPDSIDVYLPGKLAWDTIKKRVIEEKLEKLGVERGSGSNVPHIHAPHARAASISSPADPALLLFKLNKLQQTQDAASASVSLSTSPQPPPLGPTPPINLGLSPSPGGFRFPARAGQGLGHGHSMSLAHVQGPSYQPYANSPSPFNPFGYAAISGTASVAESSASQSFASPDPSVDPIYAPQGRVPMSINMNMNNLAAVPPLSAVGTKPPAGIDFVRGFGLDIPLESDEEGEELEAQENRNRNEEEEEDDENRPADDSDKENQDISAHREENELGGEDNAYLSEADDGRTTVAHSRVHSRHVSKLSAALSLRSVGGNFHAQFQNAAQQEEEEQVRNDNEEQEEQAGNVSEGEVEKNEEVDPAGEWTGSEDLYLGLDTSDDESIGEWSNPSDEERARQQRVERRNRRRAQQQQAQVDQPRRLPNFPRPPETALGRGYFQRRAAANADADDIISNPSEEENLPLGLGHRADFLGVVTEEYYEDDGEMEMVGHDGREGHGLGMPPHHSRGPSSQYSMHDPAMAHSRNASDHQFGHQQQQQQHQSSSSFGKRDSLNPFAKPFVFGASLASSSSWQSQSQSQSHAEPSIPMPEPVLNTSGSGSFTHARLPSIGKPLNVAAPEFKPGSGFSFRLPGAPQMPEPQPAPAPAPPFPEPQHHTEGGMPMESSPFRVQGREKRQRLDPDASMEEGDSMTSFKFPMKLDSSSPRNARHRQRRAGSFSSSTGAREEEDDDDDEPVQPFTFAGFSAVANNMPIVPKEPDAEDGEVLDKSHNTSGTARGYENGLESEADDVPPIGKIKRAPAPLHFNHPVSNNTVPAGLFKALVNNDERSRRSRVRSRLNSRDFGAYSRHPSMDDDDVALIAHNRPPQRFASDPERPTATGAGTDDDVFGSSKQLQLHMRRPSSGSPRAMRRYMQRQSSLPDRTAADSPVSSSAPSVQAPEPSARLSLQHLESVIAELLDEKLNDLRSDLAEQNAGTESLSPDLVASLRAELHHAAAEIMKDTRLESRGDLDTESVKSIVKEGHKELLAVLEAQLPLIVKQLPSGTNTGSLGHDHISAAVEQANTRTVQAVVEAISNLSERQEALAASATAREQDVMVERIVSALTPIVKSLHTEPVDYAFLTEQLTQSVKPHISQLIDLASDKRETAGLIIEQLLPHLPSARNMTVDTDTISMQLIAEVRKAIAPIDAFEIKEQVADLVVERLDSRFAVRDKAFNVDTVTAKVTESISDLFQTLTSVPSTLSDILAAQKVAEGKQSDLSSSHSRITASIASIPTEISSKIDELASRHSDALDKLQQSLSSSGPDSNIILIKDTVETLSSGHQSLSEQHQLALAKTQTIAERLDALPSELSGLVKGIESSLIEVVTSRDSSKRELEELRKLNTEYQVQLAKARGNYGQVRVEKDVLVEKFADVESDRNQLRAKNKELQECAANRESEKSALEKRNSELEDALAKALARLQSVDVETQTKDEKISAFEKSNAELTAEKQDLTSKVNAMDQEVGFLVKEKAALAQALESVQSKFDMVLQQQDHWKALEMATEKISMVHDLLENADNDEMTELRRYREQGQAIEDEKFALQAHVKELEKRLSASENMSNIARQNLSQAQQRAEEWERRARESEGQLEMVRTQLEQAEQTFSQLEKDYSTVKMQQDEHEAQNRLQQDKETKLRTEISALESKCTHLQSELEKINAAKRAPLTSPTPFYPRSTVVPQHTPSRPDSRASTVYDARGAAASRRVPSYASARSVVSPSPSTPPTSVWDSMHAPTNKNQWSIPAVHVPSRYDAPSTPKASAASLHSSYRASSPTPSVVSNAPTQGEDGWWS